MEQRTLKISFLSIFVAAVVGVISQGFLRFIHAITQLAFYHRFSFAPTSPIHHQLGWTVIFVPIIGALLIGLIARFGSPDIRGHGIPEAMEQVLFKQSKISPKVTLLKPLSAAISIGTGGPFGAEGPIIATGGGIGSLISQFFHLSSTERKIILSAGAAAGMTATFGSPVAAVLLAIELLLFEYRAASLIPVALASVTAQGIRVAFEGSAPFISMPNLNPPSDLAILIYVCLGILFGIFSAGIIHLLHGLEEKFEQIKIHWMWKPALGSLIVGLIALMDPKILGAGYENLENIFTGSMTLQVMLLLCIFKLLAWSISLASGTSGGTLAPLFTVGGALGGALGILISNYFPEAGIDPRMAALVGMAAIFTGTSRAFLASVVLAFEVTRQPIGLLSILGSCSSAYLISSLLIKEGLMTAGMRKRGLRVPSEYVADYLDQISVKEVASHKLVAIKDTYSVGQVQEWILSKAEDTTHQGFPITNTEGILLGVVTRRDIFDPKISPQTEITKLLTREPIVIFEDASVREAADLMAKENIGRLPVVNRKNPKKVSAIITRSDILSAHQKRLEDTHHRQRTIRIIFLEQIYKHFKKQKAH